MKLVATLVTAMLTITFTAPTVLAFCGFYVAKADTKLFNQASQVVLVRHENKTVITMANDFKGDPKEFAIVVPVPTVLEKGQIRVGLRRGTRCWHRVPWPPPARTRWPSGPVASA